MQSLIGTQKGRDRGDGRGSLYKEIIEKPPQLEFVPRRYGKYGIPDFLFFQLLHEIEKPDCVILSLPITYWYPAIEYLEQRIHDKWPDVDIVLGGLYPSLLPEHARSIKGISHVFQGISLHPFLAYLKERFPEHIDTKNLTEDFVSGRIIPDYEFLDDSTLAIIETSRGCPFSCSYCASHSLNGSFYQYPLEEIKRLFFILLQKNVRNIAFYDDALFLNANNHFKKIAQFCIKEKFPFIFHTPNGLFPRQIDREIADLMYQSNFKTVRLSLDTVSYEKQKELKKVLTADLVCAIKNLLAAGYKKHELEVYLLIGLPHQSGSDVIRGLELVASQGAVSKLAQFSPVQGTQEWLKVCELEIIDKTADPVLQNPSVYMHLNPFIATDEFWKIKHYSDRLNSQNQRSV